MGDITQILRANASGIARAVEILASGQLVAFPTETVYGLGGDARNGEAVAAIFEAKGRPSFNPLIVHVAEVADVAAIGDLPDALQPFIADGWPEGLTLVVPVKADARLSPLVTAGLETVAIRVPSSDLARRLLSAFGGPVAAPSANPSGRISATSADHVMGGLDGRIAAVLDGGETPGGLESTILGLIDGKPAVLREGLYPVPDDIQRFDKANADTGAVHAPGQLLSHYAPIGRVRLNATAPEAGEWMIGFGAVAGEVTLSAAGDLREAAAALFSTLHQADALGVKRIAVAPVPDRGLGRAINDRLRRAAAPR